MAKKSRTGGSAADYVRRSNAVSRMNAVPRGGRPSRRDEDIEVMAPYMGRDPSVSQRPVMNPRMMDAPGSRTDPGMPAEMEESGSSAPGSSMRPMPRRFKEGGKVDGFPDLNKDGKVTKADVLKGRGVEGFAEGGMVRGCKASQMSGKGFSGTY